MADPDTVQQPVQARRRRDGTLSQLLSIAREADPTALVVSLLLGLVTSLVAPFFPLLLSHLVDAAVRGDVSSLTTFAVGVAAVEAGTSAAASYASMYAWNLWERATVVIDERLVGLTTRLGLVDRVEQEDFQAHLTLVRTHREQFQQSMISVMWGALLGVQVLVTIAILVLVAPLLLLLPLFSAAPILASRWAEARIEAARRASVADTRTADGFALLALDATAAGELRVLRLRDLVLSRHEAAWNRMIDRLWRAELLATGVTVVGLALFTAGFAGSVLYVTQRSLGGATSLGSVILVLTAGQQLHSQIGGVLSNAGALFRIVDTTRHLAWLRRFVDAHEERGTRTPPATLRDGIRLESVSFRYATARRNAVDDVSVRLPAGAVVAVVGENGAGKSTLVSLLCGLHAPTSGRISVDGADLTDLDAVSWRGSVSAAFQEFVRYQLVAQDVVGLGRPERVDDLETVRGALKRADVADLEDELPDGLGTPLGRAFLDGVDLSGGQWQKLALARSMMRDKPLLLVLDEPTYSLDVESERRVFDWFSRVAATDSTVGSVTVIVSHRFSTVRAADIVLVMADGRVVESGTHTDLLAIGGQYATMYQTQAQGYQ
jgi:ATP-binding cassette, subfamily B, bacterial